MIRKIINILSEILTAMMIASLASAIQLSLSLLDTELMKLENEYFGYHKGYNFGHLFPTKSKHSEFQIALYQYLIMKVWNKMQATSTFNCLYSDTTLTLKPMVLVYSL